MNLNISVNVEGFKKFQDQFMNVEKEIQHLIDEINCGIDNRLNDIGLKPSDISLELRMKLIRGIQERMIEDLMVKS